MKDFSEEAAISDGMTNGLVDVRDLKTSLG